MRWVGAVLLISGLLGILRFESDEGFRHLWDVDWILRGHGLSSGRTAAVINLANRMMVGVGAALLLAWVVALL
jgi:hypothetical protein